MKTKVATFAQTYIQAQGKNTSTPNSHPAQTLNRRKTRSVVALFRCLAAMPSKGSTRAGILPGCPSLNRGSREAEVRFRTTDIPISKFALWAQSKWVPHKSIERYSSPPIVSIYRELENGSLFSRQEYHHHHQRQHDISAQHQCFTAVQP
ncbi:hypothetical protein T265_11371 [Opisthorchis viverrini]|uniref:Uncharacterized protein n=1 Tax=Opisthorchis viverrini TaxID=6198 RepID=A0A074ZXQ3_OPIVI|nr:hypothetical protein T265_11371 [Opisthorchis viverrini]KER19984.1 hypothetical protein T265_11371 [Opisthorchis viverrini]